MAKAEGTFASVTKGVSQQAPADRLEGQHAESVNMIFDPVRGAVRRNGMILAASSRKKFTADPSDALNDSYSFRNFPYRDGGRDYDLLYRSRARVGALSDAHLDTLVMWDKTPGTDPVRRTVVRNPADTALDLYDSGGIAALTSIGSYVLLAANSIQPNQSTTITTGPTAFAGNTGAIWVRGGSYSRTYRARARRASDGQLFDVTYTTMASAYPGVLNITGAVPIGAIGSPFEQYFVNVAQAAYDTAVNQWVAAASASIVPSNIANQIAFAFSSAGLGGWSVKGSHLFNDGVDFLEVDDGGSGDFIRAVLTDVKSADDLTDIHRVGKVVKVQPAGAQSDPYYLKAFAREPNNADAFQAVIWREWAGVIQTPNFILAMGRLVNNTFYWASTPALLQALILAQTGLTVAVPTYVASTAGDTDTVPPPHFMVSPITMLTTFQDRLGIGSGSVVNWSERGDYFNFYRTTLLTIPDSDPTEVTAAGTETDTIRTATQYDGNLTLQGDKFHYAISGKVPLIASNPQMRVQFSMSSAAYAQPQGVGKYVYLLKEDSQSASSRLLQMQAGVYQDSPEINDVSKQLRDYVNGSPAEMVALSSPSMVFVRTEHFLKSAGGFPRARPWGIYLFQYMDGDDGNRLTEAWGAWEWSVALGTPIGLSDAGTGDAILLYTYAFGGDQDGDKAVQINVLKASARSDPTGLPYLDGMQAAATAETVGMLTPSAVAAVQAVVYTATSAAHSYSAVPGVTDADRYTGLEHPHYAVADAPPEDEDPYRWAGVQGWAADYIAAYPGGTTDNLWTGTSYDSFIDLTNPYVRDRDGKAQLNGVLNLVEYFVTLTRTAGFKSSWIDHDGTVQMDGFREAYSRIAYNQPVWIGRESKDVQVRLSAVDWLPMTINSIGWKANWFAYKGRA